MLKCLSINLNGVGKDFKRNWVKSMAHSHKVDLHFIQETRMGVSDFTARGIGGKKLGNWITSPPVGNSGGLISFWDHNCIGEVSNTVDRHFITTIGISKTSKQPWGFINVYAPQSAAEKQTLWAKLHDIISQDPNREWVVVGDFNEVRFKEERKGSHFVTPPNQDLGGNVWRRVTSYKYHNAIRYRTTSIDIKIHKPYLLHIQKQTKRNCLNDNISKAN